MCVVSCYITLYLQNFNLHTANIFNVIITLFVGVPLSTVINPTVLFTFNYCSKYNDLQRTEVRFASFLSSGFTTMALINKWG